MWTLRLLGRASIEGPDGLLTGRVAQRRVLALLAVLAVDRAGAVRRDRLTVLLSPEADTERARHQLRDAVYAARAALGDDVIGGPTDELALSRQLLACDVWAFERALDDGRLRDAVAAYAGPFLEGFHLQESPEFDQWATRERDRLAARCAEALETLAGEATARAAHEEAAGWWTRRLAMDPLHVRATLGAMTTLEAAGDVAGALRRAAIHASLMDSELGTPPDASVLALAERIRRDPRPAAAGATRTHAQDTPPEVTAPAASRPALDQPSAYDPGSVAQPSGPAPTSRSPVATVRPGRVLALASALLAVAVMAMAWWIRRPGAGTDAASRGSDARTSRPEVVAGRVAVVPLRNATGDERLDDIGWMAADWVIQGIVAARLASVVPLQAAAAGDLPPSAATGTIGSAPWTAEDRRHTADVATATGAALVVRGAFYRSGDTLLLQAWIADAGSGEVRRAMDPVRGTVSAPLPAVEQLRHRVLVALAPLLDVRMATTAGAMTPPPSVEAYREHAQGLAAFSRFDLPTALRHFDDAAVREPTWLTPRIWGAVVRWNSGDHPGADSAAHRVLQDVTRTRATLLPVEDAMLHSVLAWARGDRVAAYEAARRGRDAAPGSQMVTEQVAVEALRLGRVREAVSLLRTLDPDHGELRDWVYVWVDLAEALHLAGDHAGEWAAVREARRRHPDAVEGRLLEVRALAAEGRSDALHRLLDDVLATPSAPYVRRLAREAAQELHVHGHGAVADTFDARAADGASPPAPGGSAVSRLNAIGRAAWRDLQRGDASAAARMDSVLASWTVPYSFGRDHWWRAAFLGARGDCAAAAAALREALRRGQEFGVELHNAAEFRPLRRCSEWEALARPRDG